MRKDQEQTKKYTIKLDQADVIKYLEQRKNVKNTTPKTTINSISLMDILLKNFTGSELTRSQNTKKKDYPNMKTPLQKVTTIQKPQNKIVKELIRHKAPDLM